MNTRFLYLAIIASGCVLALPAYAAPAVVHPITRPEVLQHDFKLIWERHEGDEYTSPAAVLRSDVKSGPDALSSSQGEDNDGAKDSAPATAPEIDPAMAGGALTLLAAGIALLGGRRRIVV